MIGEDPSGIDFFVCAGLYDRGHIGLTLRLGPEGKKGLIWDLYRIIEENSNNRFRENKEHGREEEMEIAGVIRV